LGVPGDRRFEEEVVEDEAETAACDTGADVVVELSLLSLVALGEAYQALGIDVVADLGRVVAKGSGGQQGQTAAATHRHRCGAVAPGDFGVTPGAGLVPDKQSGDGKE